MGVKNGDIIIAKNDDSWGRFEEGDTLKVSFYNGNGVIAKNLTRPWLKESVLLNSEYKVVEKPEKKRDKDDSYRVYFLGIPLFKAKKVVK